MGIFNFKKKQSDNDESNTPKSFGENLSAAFKILCHNDSEVMDEIKACLKDTEAYYNVHQDEFEDRGLEYSPEGEKWLQLIAAVDLMEDSGYTAELDYKEEAEEFAAALADILEANDIEFSLQNLKFAPEKNIPDWVAQFNEYAGQSGITVYSVDIDSDCFVLGAAEITDYAKAADIAADAGIRISCRPQ